MTGIEAKCLEQLALGPLTMAELCREVGFTRTPVDSAIRLLLDAGRVKVTSVRAGAGRPAKVYQIVERA